MLPDPIRRMTAVLALLVAPAFLVGPTLAQSGAQGGTPTFIDLFGQRLLYTHPDWVDGAPPDEILSGVKVNRQQTEDAFLIEFIPADQSFEDWTDLSAIIAKRGGTTIQSELDEIEANFRKGCAPETLVVIRSDTMASPPDVRGEFATIFCGAFSFDPARGEVAAFRVVEKDDVVARLYREWRGSAFDPTERSTMPVDVEEVSRINSRLLAADFER